MKALLSRFKPSYITKLAYMLQASDYRPGDFLYWFERTGNFNTIGQRQQLIKTARTRVLLLLLWLIAVALISLLASYLLVIFQLFSSDIRSALSAADLRSLLISSSLIALFYVLVLPWAVAYLAILPVALGRLIFFMPYQWWMVRTARRIIRKHPALKIAVAGSFGKTTMKEILNTVLSAGKQVAVTPANFNTPIGISRFAKTLSGDEEVLVFEFGEYKPKDVRGFCKLTSPDIGIIIGVNEAHLSQFKSLKATASNIFTLANYVKPGRLYVNEENAIARKLKPARALGYSRRGVDGWKVTQAVSDLSGTRFTAHKQSRRISARSRLLGLHQIGALAVAIDIADKLGLAAPQIEAAIAKTEPFKHRLQPYDQAGITIIDDTYNGNPDGVMAALEFLKGLKSKRTVYVTPGLVEMGERNQPVHEAMGRQLAKIADAVMLIKTPASVHIAAGLDQAKFKGELKWFDDPASCYQALEQHTKLGDVVLLQNDWPEHYL